MVRIAERGTTERYASLFGELERERRGREPSWLAEARSAALERFLDLGFPTPRSEPWKYTQLAPLAKIRFAPAAERHFSTREAEEALRHPGLAPLVSPAFSKGAARLVFVDGRLAPELSSGLGPAAGSGLRVRSLSEALADEPEPLRWALREVEVPAERVLEALSTAFFSDGALVHVAQEGSIDAPVHLLFLSRAGREPRVSFPRVLVVAERESRVQVIETHLSYGNAGDKPGGKAGARGEAGGGGAYWTNAVTQVRAGPGAWVEHFRLQEESEAAFHLAATDATLERGASFRSHLFGFGARLARNEVRVSFRGSGGSCELRGLYVPDGERHLDCQTLVDHAVPDCQSDQVYRGIVADRARGVFGGRVLVRPDAQRASADQSSKSLLLSEHGSANTKPQLEIYADDVRCSHGATVSQIDEDLLFYLRSRGISDAAARRMLALGFASAVLEGVELPVLTARVEDQLRERLSQAGGGRPA